MTIQEQCAKLMRETWGPTDEELYVEQMLAAAIFYHSKLVETVWTNTYETH